MRIFAFKPKRRGLTLSQRRSALLEGGGHRVVQGGGGAVVIQRGPSDNQSDTEAQRAIHRIRAYRKRRRDTNSDPGI
jgi:hypothetical protein